MQGTVAADFFVLDYRCGGSVGLVVKRTKLPDYPTI
jgi:hypothetical protein